MCKEREPVRDPSVVHIAGSIAVVRSARAAQVYPKRLSAWFLPAAVVWPVMLCHGPRGWTWFDHPWVFMEGTARRAGKYNGCAGIRTLRRCLVGTPADNQIVNQ